MNAQRVNEDIGLLFNLRARWKWVVNATPRPLYPRERDAVPIVQGRSGRVRKISPLTGPRSPDHPVRGESLYRLCYPGLLSNIAHTIKRRKGDWIGPIFCRNCTVKHVIAGKIEGRIEVTGRRGRTRKQLLVDLKETRGYWKLKEGARDRTLWRTRFGRG